MSSYNIKEENILNSSIDELKSKVVKNMGYDKYYLSNDDVIKITDPEGVEHTLHRLIALKVFNKYVMNEGLLGGYVEGLDNLRQDGSCWIGKYAKVYGGAVVEKDAVVLGESTVNNGAIITDNARVIDSHINSRSAYEGEEKTLQSPTIIAGNARVINANVDYSQICDNAVVQGKLSTDIKALKFSTVKENNINIFYSTICDDAKVKSAEEANICIKNSFISQNADVENIPKQGDIVRNIIAQRYFEETHNVVLPGSSCDMAGVFVPTRYTGDMFLDSVVMAGNSKITNHIGQVSILDSRFNDNACVSADVKSNLYIVNSIVNKSSTIEVEENCLEIGGSTISDSKLAFEDVKQEDNLYSYSCDNPKVVEIEDKNIKNISIENGKVEAFIPSIVNVEGEVQ